MKTSNLVGLVTAAALLFLLAAEAVHLDPALAGVVEAILLGVAAIITAINRTPPAVTNHPADADADDTTADEGDHEDTDDADTDDADTDRPDNHEPDAPAP